MTQNVENIIPPTYDSFIKDGMQSMIEKLKRQQEAFVFNTLVHDHGYTGTIDELFEYKRFPKICIVYDQKYNKYYFFNDGTPDGKLIAGFSGFEYKYDDNRVTISYKPLLIDPECLNDKK